MKESKRSEKFNRLEKIGCGFDYINRIFIGISCLLLIFDMVLICAEVVARKFFQYSIPGAIELTEYSLLYITFLGAAWMLRREGHIKMDMILNALNLRVQSILSTITSVIGAIICVVLTWYSAELTWDQIQTGHFRPTTLEIPVAFTIAIIPIGSFLLFVEFLRRGLRYGKNWRAVEQEKTIESI